MTIDTIVSDLDDTLLDGSSQLSDYTLRVMAECKRRGIRLIPASGRTASSILPYARKLDTGMPYIGGNGSEIIGADHKIMRTVTITPDLAKEIINALLKESFHVHVYRDDAFYYGEETEAARRYMQSSKLRGVAVGDLCAFLDFPTPKVLAVGEPETVARMLPILTERFAGRATFTMSKPYFLEAEPTGVSKGNALQTLAGMRGDIFPERTLAFGDSLNDQSLLAFTPNSVAMENGRNELKQQAAYICRPNTEDGVARFVEEHVL